MQESTPPNIPASERTSPWIIVIAWLVVSIPALWGVAQTARTSAKLFRAPAAQTTAVKPAAPAHP